jgi:hypothetical protein
MSFACCGTGNPSIVIGILPETSLNQENNEYSKEVGGKDDHAKSPVSLHFSFATQS